MNTLVNDDASEVTMNGSPSVRHFSESPLITIYVGDERRKFVLHQDKICAKSDYFKACFNNPHFLECQKNEIVMKGSDGHDSEAFGVVSDWIYDGRKALNQYTSDGVLTGRHLRQRVWDVQTGLTRVYIQADKLMMTQMKNQITDRIIEQSDDWVASLEPLRILSRANLLQSCLAKYFCDSITSYQYNSKSFQLMKTSTDEEGTKWREHAKAVLQEDGEVAYLILEKLCERIHEDDGNHPCYHPIGFYHEREHVNAGGQPSPLL